MLYYFLRNTLNHFIQVYRDAKSKKEMFAFLQLFLARVTDEW